MNRFDRSRDDHIVNKCVCVFLGESKQYSQENNYRYYAKLVSSCCLIVLTYNLH